jgi:hypothetical protein
MLLLRFYRTAEAMEYRVWSEWTDTTVGRDSAVDHLFERRCCKSPCPKLFISKYAIFSKGCARKQHNID